MITNVLLDHPWLSPAALALMVLLGPALGWWLAPRPRLAWWLTGLSLLPVVLLTLVPVDRTLYGRCRLAWDGMLPTPGRVELMANVVLFVVPVLLAGVAARRPVLVFLAGSALSAGIEAVQANVAVIGRSCDAGDWVSNTIGAAIGAVLAGVALLAARRSGSDRSRPRGLTIAVPLRPGRPGRRPACWRATPRSGPSPSRACAPAGR